MLKIAICDDEKQFRESIKEYVLQYTKKMLIDCEIDTYSSGKDFIATGIEMIKYKIVFLDINMSEIDGITTAKVIRKYSEEVFIVFVTAYIDYTLEGYKVEAIRYILKDNDNFEHSIKECLNTIFKKINYQITKERFEFNEGVKVLNVDRILYVESSLHKLDFHIMEQDLKIYSMYDRLDNIESKLAKYDFIRIHQSYLVNLKYIKCVHKFKVLLSNNIELVIPKARYRQVKEVFVAYKGEM
ncbi:LytR/AlgR family response regulator transcription factor [Konateibacter massiliensis]|uniref:LytR/AlgR family response regulator transcription factor n=1 Tax=Konateibacter massiliensis TaxID=2002841 RepID=UPI000C1534F5|nr:LytTR family DNA-binding domain-containing protein [Konateibacter massiliensis]